MSDSLSFDEGARPGDPIARPFPDDFLFGAATSAHQVEGANVHNDWWAWEHADPVGRLRDGQPSGDACGWWAGRAEDDLRLAAELGHGAHRLSLEWSRLEPTPGRRAHAAVDRYRAILGAARDLGLKTMVTVNHFTLPAWARRGWLDRKLPERFAEHAEFVAGAFGDLVDLWATLNEPIVLAAKAYGSRAWPPGIGRPTALARALRAQMEAHAGAYHVLRERTPSVPVGLVLNLPSFEPARPRLIADRIASATQGWVVGGALLSAIRNGRCLPPVGVVPSWMPKLIGTLDFLGINYYGRYVVKADGFRPGGRHVQENTRRTETTDWGEPWPGGLVDELRGASTMLGGIPMYVTENGIYDAEDELRPRFVVEHVAAVHEAIDQGVDVRGYFHWSLVDNFEWAQGWSTPFGLVGVDRDTGERHPKESARVFAAVARARGIPEPLARRFGLSPISPPLSGAAVAGMRATASPESGPVRTTGGRPRGDGRSAPVDRWPS
jgi:beta-glucosidase